MLNNIVKEIINGACTGGQSSVRSIPDADGPAVAVVQKFFFLITIIFIRELKSGQI